ncbi:MAG: hypothetical protein ABSA59_05575 [Terriglobia bacterium]
MESKSNLVVDSHIQNEGNGWAGSGANPWHLDDDTESILFLTNESDKAARFGFCVTANDIHYYLTMLRLNPHETRVIDLRKLRDAQVPDYKNNLIPANATDGSVTWIRSDNVPVMGRLMIINRHAGMASNYDCCTCPCPSTLMPYYAPEVTPYGAILAIGDSVQLDATVYYLVCNYLVYPEDVTDYVSWSEADQSGQSVATVNGQGVVTAQNQGIAQISTSEIDDCANYYYDDSQWPPCTCVDWEGVAGVATINVTTSPSIWGPARVPLSTGGSNGQNSISLSAIVYPSGGSYSWTTSSSKVSLSGASSSTVTVTAVAASANRGDVPITLTYTYNNQPNSATANITVVQPSTLQVIGDTTNSSHTCVGGTGTNACFQSYFTGSGSYSSYLRWRTYLIMDQFTNDRQWIQGFNLDIQESYSTPTGPCSGSSVAIGRSSLGDTIQDCFYFCAATCQSNGSCSVSATQTATVNGYTVVAESVTWTCSGVSVSP